VNADDYENFWNEIVDRDFQNLNASVDVYENSESASVDVHRDENTDVENS